MARKKKPEPEPEEDLVEDEPESVADDEELASADDETSGDEELAAAEGDEEDLPPDDDEPEEDPADEEDSGDDDHPDISQFFGGGGGGDDDDDDAAEVGVSDDDYEDEEEGRPFYKRPILIVSLTLLLLVGTALGWSWVSFDHDAYVAANTPPTLVAALTPPAPTAAPEAATEHAAAPTEGTLPTAAAPTRPPAQTAAATPPAAAAPGAAQPTAARTPAGAPPVAAAPAPEVALAPAPDPALVAPTENGPLPIIAEDGRQPWRVYARPFALLPETPKIAIVIGGMGLSRAATQAAIQQLPPDVTLAFAPYAPNLEAQIAEARAAGHEVVLQLPMEPNGYPANDPGPHTLLANATAEDNLLRLHWLLSRFSGYVGVTNYMGAKLSTSADALRPILADLNSRGLMFLDARESANSVAADIAGQLNMPRAVNNTFLDTEASRSGVDARLLELERLAGRQGGAVGIGYAYPVTIERVAAWVRGLQGKNVALAPLSALARTAPAGGVAAPAPAPAPAAAAAPAARAAAPAH